MQEGKPEVTKDASLVNNGGKTITEVFSVPVSGHVCITIETKYRGFPCNLLVTVTTLIRLRWLVWFYTVC